MNQGKLAKEQIMHILSGMGVFLLIGLVAALLDYLSTWLGKIGVSTFTSTALGYAAHGILFLDLVVFFSYSIAVCVDFVKGVFKND
jgi:hypothetical protein